MGATFGLIANVGDDKDLLVNLIHEAGNLFYQKIGKNRYKVAYFSNSRIVVFEGKLDEETAKFIEAIGYNISRLEIDEENKLVIIEK